MKTTLSIEDSARLIELGVDAKLASATCLDFNGSYAYISGEEADWVKDRINEHYYTENPIVFSLSDLLSILPKEIEQEDRHPMTVVYYWNSTKKEWIAYYDYVENTIMASAPELIDALNQLAIWCLEQEHLKTETK